MTRFSQVINIFFWASSIVQHSLPIAQKILLWKPVRVVENEGGLPVEFSSHSVTIYYSKVLGSIRETYS